MSGFVKKVADLSKKFVAQILLVIIVILFAVLESERFFTVDNILTIIRQVATTGIVALGVSFLMLTGNLDFSVGKVYAFAGVACALLYQAGCRCGWRLSSRCFCVWLCVCSPGSLR